MVILSTSEALVLHFINALEHISMLLFLMFGSTCTAKHLLSVSVSDQFKVKGEAGELISSS